MTPEEVVEGARRAGCRSISYTYTEPTMFYEYAFDIARLAKDAGIFNNFVTNGYIEEEPLAAIRPYLDAANIDLKGFSEGFYRKVCGAQLEGVLVTIKKLQIPRHLDRAHHPRHPRVQRQRGGIRKIAAFIAEEVGAETPWHVSAFHPTYKLTDACPTPPEHSAGQGNRARSRAQVRLHGQHPGSGRRAYILSRMRKTGHKEMGILRHGV